MKPPVPLKTTLIFLAVIFLSGCGNHMGSTDAVPESFSSNGERIYFTGVSANGISVQPVPAVTYSHHKVGTCASCHGVERQGGIRMMPFFWVKSPALTQQALFDKAEPDDGHGDHESYTAASLAHAIRQGIDPSGKALGSSMPRWHLSDADMQDLTDFLSN